MRWTWIAPISLSIPASFWLWSPMQLASSGSQDPAMLRLAASFDRWELREGHLPTFWDLQGGSCSSLGSLWSLIKTSMTDTHGSSAKMKDSGRHWLYHCYTGTSRAPVREQPACLKGPVALLLVVQPLTYTIYYPGMRHPPDCPCPQSQRRHCAPAPLKRHFFGCASDPGTTPGRLLFSIV